MHELGVVFYVIRDVKEIAEENCVSHVESITLQIGEVTGIVDHLLTDCFDWAKKKEPVLEDARLIIEPVKAMTYCSECGRNYPTLEHGKTCPFCQSNKTWLICGDEFIIREISVMDDEDPDRTPSES